MWSCNLTPLSTAGTLLVAMVSARAHHGRFHRRDDCTTQTVAFGDRCGSLASKCGISLSDLTKYNPNPKFCTTLSPGQRVCCSPGTLPDLRPQPQSDGACASYVVQAGNTCSSIAAANGLNVEDLSTYNDGTTWGWSGCGGLSRQLRICLSEGSPPMPQAIDNAVCGPLKPGSQPPSDGKTLADLNPCPLNACCTTWGQCGITPEFCNNDTAASTGNPGTAPPGRSGCISNCGTDIKNNGAAGPVSSPISIGYYESWNFDRRCLNMRADSVDTSKYTHYHWAFAAINPTTFEVSINDTYNQWARFTGLTGIKRIVSLGGYGFSTDPSTASIFRLATHPANASLFAANIAAFLATHNLDGVDIDWEYPDNPEALHPSSSAPSDGPHYLAFLTLLRAALPSNASLSIAAPASYWYLQHFPIAAMSPVLDYLVYMTYDLHGQWDYGNAFGQPGCPGGNCLRSHVNLTETLWALGMVTKAGVPPAKVAVGLAAYGRSLGMAERGCTGPECAFEGGPNSTAWSMADCTQTPGLAANAEIEVMREVARTGTRAWLDEGSDSDVLVYPGGDDAGARWVAYMGEETRRSRAERYGALGFGGTADWAVDLLRFGDDERDPEGDGRRPAVPAGGR